jgi:hypothetical protein
MPSAGNFGQYGPQDDPSLASAICREEMNITGIAGMPLELLPKNNARDQVPILAVKNVKNPAFPGDFHRFSRILSPDSQKSPNYS